jgi:hypothetical protein
MMRRLIIAALVLAAFAVPTPAKAGLLPVQVSITPEAGMYRYTYAIVLPTDARLRAGDYFTIFDFDGFVSGSEMADGSPYSADWTFSASNIGPTPAGTVPDDSGSITNLTWSYNGAEINIDASVGLGNFWALSLYGETTDSWFAASTGSTAGPTDNNITPTTVPVPTRSDPVPGVPEPTTLLLAGLGLPLVAVVRRRSVRKAG